MFNTSSQSIIIFIVCVVSLLVLFCTFTVAMIYRYQQKQNIYYKDLEELKVTHENALLQTQLEIQEQTFQNISREIHDNIGQKLTLAKLYLNILGYSDISQTAKQVRESVLMISEAINDLSDISRSMSSDVILNNGLIKGIEIEVAQLQKSGMFDIDFSIIGNSLFLNNRKELVLFRILQEALNNIIKHANATKIYICIDYGVDMLTLKIKDNGTGLKENYSKHNGTGLFNIRKRAEMLKGVFSIRSNEQGTTLIIEIPIHGSNNAL